MCSRRDPRTMARMRLTIPLLATSVALLLVPAAAQAGTLSYDGNTLYFQAAGGERNSPFLDKTDDGRLSIVETGLTIAGGCEQEFSWGPAYCPMPSKIVMYLEDGDDGVGFASTFPAIAVEVYGGDGKDNLKGYGAANALLDGGAGNDILKGWQTDEDAARRPRRRRDRGQRRQRLHRGRRRQRHAARPTRTTAPATTTSTAAPAST